MAGKFQWCKFSDVDLSDVFFDSLKSDYEEFPEWFAKKSAAGESSLVFYDELGIGSFVYLKEENEPIELTTGSLPAMPRLKIGTLRLAKRFIPPMFYFGRALTGKHKARRKKENDRQNLPVIYSVNANIRSVKYYC